MFARESDMTPSVGRWMESIGLAVKPEFVTPWGICDLVGLAFDATKVEKRLKLRQTRPVSSITRAALLLRIPDVDDKRSITLQKLVRQTAATIPERVVREETARLIADRYVVVTSCHRLQRVNGWMPLQSRLVSVELKLSRIEEAMRQAMNHLGFANESYVALPIEVARRVAKNPSRWSSYLAKGVGVLGVTPNQCEVVLPALDTTEWTDSATQFYCVEKFWRTRAKGS